MWSLPPWSISSTRHNTHIYIHLLKDLPDCWWTLWVYGSRPDCYWVQGKGWSEASLALLPQLAVPPDTECCEWRAGRQARLAWRTCRSDLIWWWWSVGRWWEWVWWTWVLYEDGYSGDKDDGSDDSEAKDEDVAETTSLSTVCPSIYCMPIINQQYAHQSNVCPSINRPA